MLHNNRFNTNVVQQVQMRQMRQLRPSPQVQKNMLYNFRGRGKKALLIGINYNGTRYQLAGCINDAMNLRNVLVGRYGFNSANVNVLTDNTVIKPTRDNILNNIKAMLQGAQSGDVLFLSYSGHGSFVTDRNNEEKDRKDEVLVGCDIKNITDDELKQLLMAHLKPTVTLVVLSDSCFSGTVFDLKYQYMDTQYNTQISNNGPSQPTPGTVVLISGCQDNQYSEDAYINKMNQGAMTWSFLAQLAATPRPTWRNLVTGMRTLLKSRGYTQQVPQLSTGRLMDVANTTINF
jgi:hypothetical protein